MYITFTFTMNLCAWKTNIFGLFRSHIKILWCSNFIVQVLLELETNKFINSRSNKLSRRIFRLNRNVAHVRNILRVLHVKRSTRLVVVRSRQPHTHNTPQEVYLQLITNLFSQPKINKLLSEDVLSVSNVFTCVCMCTAPLRVYKLPSYQTN